MLSLQILVVALKFLVPLIMLKVPFFGAWGNYFLDVVDGDVLLSLGMSDYFYQTIDKIADYFSYIVMLTVGMRWRIKNTIITLFVYRTIGQILFFLTRNELMFFIFQNFLEPLVMIYALLLLLKKGNEEKTYQSYKKHFAFIWGIVLIYKIWNEWYLHYANIDLSLIFFGFTGGM